ncbi:GrpB family protein [Metabacillus sp. JX24]|uniref:GrpB family protein n=1 Tax=Metabacillus sp. JX24 TaxID=3240759 RepID=UPI00350FA1B3
MSILPLERNEYAEIKRQLARDFNDDRKRYTEGKTEFFNLRVRLLQSVIAFFVCFRGSYFPARRLINC